eukprot:scaffold62324_cov66-Phaeocystis_antarctica.AAC.2
MRSIISRHGRLRRERRRPLGVRSLGRHAEASSEAGGGAAAEGDQAGSACEGHRRRAKLEAIIRSSTRGAAVSF